ncbi:cytochrome-c peroxidase [Enhygromyxa salina]|uniref:Cytochrome c551 peroxidase n=1 Tax=Enhygromyxa salina TaxID=215803 RepID=A0A2S9YLH0_9BACT|nr:cytochrome c peroxidase [Enhygromyxa salina]PRQ05930.1 Cytochrome c551 peroxidase precursor [Enhygromyxa salina]
MKLSGQFSSRTVAPAGCLALLASLALPACDGGGGHGEAHGAAIEVHAGRVPLTPPEQPELDPAALRERAAKVFGVLPEEFPNANNPATEAKITLGRMLYYDGRLSLSGDISCNTCHALDRFGVDNLPTSPGHLAQLGERNSPTVYNAAGHLAQFWDGRSVDVEDQAKGPVLNPVEMAMPDEATVVARLAAIPGYVEQFAAAFPDAEEPVSFDNMASAIGVFERKLTTPAPIDAWLAGDDSALSTDALAGLQLFLDTDCQSCHNGFNFGGASYQKVGTEKPWPGLRDNGRFVVTQDERDRFVFKVPTLRNIAETAPYLHDGSIASLPDIVAKMVEHQTKRAGPFSPEEMTQMLAFLGSMTGEIPTDYIAKPELPMDAAPEATPEPAESDGDVAEPKPKPPKPAKPAEPPMPADGE